VGTRAPPAIRQRSASDPPARPVKVDSLPNPTTKGGPMAKVEDKVKIKIRKLDKLETTGLRGGSS
jgi:hypothetical protein